MHAPPAGAEQNRETTRVDERNPAQVDHQPPRLGRKRLVDRDTERRSVSDVELPTYVEDTCLLDMAVRDLERTVGIRRLLSRRRPVDVPLQKYLRAPRRV